MTSWSFLEYILEAVNYVLFASLSRSREENDGTWEQSGLFLSEPIIIINTSVCLYISLNPEGFFFPHFYLAAPLGIILFYLQDSALCLSQFNRWSETFLFSGALGIFSAVMDRNQLPSIDCSPWRALVFHREWSRPLSSKKLWACNSSPFWMLSRVCVHGAHLLQAVPFWPCWDSVDSKRSFGWQLHFSPLFHGWRQHSLKITSDVIRSKLCILHDEDNSFLQVLSGLSDHFLSICPFHSLRHTWICIRCT